MMQSPETGDRVPEMPTATSLPHHSSKPSINGVAGFSHGAFNSNRPSLGGFRDRHGGNVPAINTTRDMPNHAFHAPVDGQTPSTGFDMNYTPLLPSQLLMGSPFQPGSPSTFASPQFQTFSNLTPIAPNHQAQNHGQPMGSPIQPHQPLAPQYHNMLSAVGLGGSQFFPRSQFSPGNFGAMGHGFGHPMHMNPGLNSGTSRTVYLGNIPPDTSAEEILGHVRSGQIESVRLLPDKNCAFISFLDSGSAVHFHSDAILKKLSIRGQDIKIGWGKPSQIPSAVALAVQQSGASRNVYLGNLPAEITEEEIRSDLGKFGAIDTVKMVREKSIAFVHFLSISGAIKAVNQLPQEPNWQPPRRVFYGKDRCAYVSKTQQQNAAQYLGIAPGYAHVLNSADRDVISNALAQQSVAAAAVATAAGGVNNLGNRTVYLGNIHPETTAEEICNVVRGGLLHHIRYIPDKHICFVTFIDPTSAASFYAMSNMQGLMIHNRRLKIGWGKHSQALPPAIALAVSGGASRNVYIGNIDESWTEERLRQDFSEYGEIELVNTLREKSCAFVNFTNIANAIKAIEGIRDKEEYKRFKINFGKDRCGNPPRQLHNNVSEPLQQMNHQGVEGPASPIINGGLQLMPNSHPNSSASPVGSGVSRGPGSEGNALTNGTSSHGDSNMSHMAMYLPSNQNHNQAQAQHPQQGYESTQQQQHQQHQHQQQQMSPVYVQNQEQNHNYNTAYFGGATPAVAPAYSRHQSFEVSRSQQQGANAHNSSNSFSANHTAGPGGAPTIGGMLAPSSAKSAQHSRAISLPAFSQYYGPGQQIPPSTGYMHNVGYGNAGGVMTNGYGLAIHGESTLPRWAEEEGGS